MFLAIIFLPVLFPMCWILLIFTLMTSSACRNDMRLLLGGNFSKILKCRILPVPLFCVEHNMKIN